MTRDAWQRAASLLEEDFRTGNFELLAGNAKALAENFLPPEAIETLRTIGAAQHPPIAVLKNLPIDEMLPRTPTDGRRPFDKRTSVSESVLYGVTGAADQTIFGYREEKEGALIH